MSRARVVCTVAFSSLITLTLSSPGLMAGGFEVSEQSPVAAGTGGAGTARVDDASLAWYNPAALADDGGWRMGLGILAAFPTISASAVDDTWQRDTEGGPSTPPHLFASYGANGITWGVAALVPFGGGVAWPEDWEGRHEIISSKIEVFRAAPFVALRDGKFSMAGGFHLDRGRLRIHRSLDFVDTEGEVQLDMAGTGFGFDLAFFYAATESLRWGLTYKSRSTIDFSGVAKFDSPDAFAAKTADQGAKTSMTLPDRFALGANWQRGKIQVLCDVIFTLWQTNKTLAIDFENEETPDAMQANEWESTFSLRGGLEFRPKAKWTLRGGAFLDQSPAQDNYLAPSSPDSTRLGATLGMSRQIRAHTHVDFFYEYMSLLERTSANDNALAARYQGRVHMMGLGVRLQN